jgi:plasmid stability protein
MPRREKGTDVIRVHLNETLKSDLRVVAARQGADSLSAFIRKVLRDYVYGHGNERRDILAGTVRDE